jgi:hypothetical protein
MVIHIQIKNRQRGNIQKKNTYQLGMQHREYLEVAKLAEVPHRLDFDTLGDKRENFRMTNEQNVRGCCRGDKRANFRGCCRGDKLQRLLQRLLRIQSSEIEPGTEGNTRTTTTGKQRIEGGVRERNRKKERKRPSKVE